MQWTEDEKRAYLVTQIEDEFKLAPLLGWLDVAKPSTLNGMANLMGAHKLQAATVANARQARTFLPRWRRDWGSCGDLLALCKLNIFQTGHLMTVTPSDHRPGEPNIMCHENANHHPTHDDALRCAIVRCATQVLLAGRKQ